MLLTLPALVLALSLPAGAQTTRARSDDNSAIIVTGRHEGKVEMSDWHVAETEHVLVYGKGDQRALGRLARNLEKLHFLLSMQFDRVDEPDNAVKLRITLFGDIADFNQLGLANVRWQQGPYPRAFPTGLYYDPREDGAVLATTAADQTIIVEPGRSLSSVNLAVSTSAADLRAGRGGAVTPVATPDPANSLVAHGGTDAAQTVNGTSFKMTAEGRIYAGFAQHFLLTYFPAAYPRWYVEGFGEIFATFDPVREGAMEYGRAPEGFREVMEWYRHYPVRNVLNGRYLEDDGPRPRWTPYHAWALVHLLFFDDRWKQPLHNYLAAVARGAPPEEAARALGDLDKLDRQLAGYRGAKVPFERMTFQRGRSSEPIVRQLRRSEAVSVIGRLELGAKLEIPPGPDQEKAIERRNRWLAELRQDASRYSTEPELQLLLAEAECRSGNNTECIAAADRTLGLAPQSSPALAWKGLALARQAVTGPASERASRLRAARAIIARANRADPESLTPLLAYYRSFADAGETAPALAVEGLAKIVDSVPAAPGPRLLLGKELAARGDAVTARRILRPVALGPYEAPERREARQILESLLAK